MSNLGRKLLDKPYALWAVLFVLAPLCMVVYYAFTDTGGAFSLHSVSQIPSYLSTILLSVLYGLAATVICLLLGYPFAYLISKHAARRQRTVVLLVMLPMWMNFLIRTYSWMTILGDSGVINSFLTAVGLEPAKLINTGGAVILGMVYNFLPYMILPIYSVLSKLDGSLIEAAEDLGSSRASGVSAGGVAYVFARCTLRHYHGVCALCIYLLYYPKAGRRPGGAGWRRDRDPVPKRQ